MNEREKLPQHEPLRVPQGWQEQARALVIQIERVFTDVYRWLGNLMKRIAGCEDSVASKISKGKFYSGSSGVSITLEKAKMYLIVAVSSAPSTHSGLFCVSSMASGNVQVVDYAIGTAVSHTTGTNTITFAHSSSFTTRYAVIELCDIT